MAEHIEGDWNGFTFELIGPSEWHQVCQHLESNFYLDEPLLKKIGLSRDGMDDFNAFTAELLEHKLSFWVRETSTGKIAGMRLTMSHEKETNYDELREKFTSPEILKILCFIIALDKKTNICEEYGVDKYADFVFASVDRDFRGRGLATEMYNRALKFLKASGFLVAKSSFTSPFTRKIASKIGFRELARQYFRDWKGPDGLHICPDAGEDEFGAIMTMGLD